MSLKDLQPIVPKANLEDYVITIYGNPKVGKTTLAFNLGKEHFGSTKESLILGFEDGFKALTGAMAVSIKDWSHFLELSEELIEDKEDDNELPYKFLILDTIDGMSNMASKYVVRRESRADSKKYKTIKDIPWGRGGEALRVEIQDAIERLSKHYGVLLITHSKEKKIEPKVGASYDTTTLSLDGKVLDVVKNISDFIVYLSIEREKGKDKEGKRYMYFRDESMFEAGSRFPKIKSKVPYGAKNFIEVVKDAVESANKGISSVNEVEDVIEDEVVEPQVEDSNETEVDESTIDPAVLAKELLAKAKALKGEKKDEFREHLDTEYGTTRLSQIKEVSQLLAIQKHLEQL